MEDTLKKAIINIGGVIEYVDYTPEEIAQREAEQAAYLVEKQLREDEEAAKAAAKASAFEKLSAIAGLTPEEIAAL